MSKSIGIKLADGAFYPILEEGKAAQVSMDLTTVKDNQESVHIDLYRSESGTLEDAEYVDTLQIENIKPHPNGEPNLRMEISLSEENTLAAKVSDLESGKQSNITVSLVSRPEDERASVDDGTSLQFSEPPVEELVDAGLGEDAVQAKSFADDTNDTLDLDNLVFDADESQTIDAEDELAAVDDGTSPQFTEPLVEESVDAGLGEDAVQAKSFADDTDDTLDLDNLVFETDESQIIDAEDIMFDDEKPSASPENLSTDSSAESSDQIEDDAFDNAGITTAKTGDELSDDFFDNAINEFLDDTPPQKTNQANFAQTGAKKSTAFSIDFDDLPPFEDLKRSDSDFKIDFDNTPPPLVQHKKGGAALNFYDDDFNIDDVKPVASKEDFSDTPQNVLFTDLYDDDDFIEEERTETKKEKKKKSRTGIIALICLLCAAICAAVFLLFLFVIPSRINIRLGSDEKQLVETTAPEEEHPPAPPVDQIIFTDRPITIVPIPAPQGQLSDQSAQTQEQAAPAQEQAATQEQTQAQQPPQEQSPPPAQEQAKAQEPPPVQEQPPVQQKPVETAPKSQPVRYRIKWGDTLWDIAWAYYRDPWRYTYIARYNGIKNPDKITADTVILIPPR